MKNIGFKRIATMSFATAGVLALTLMAPTMAAAQAGGMTPEQACHDDAFRFCNDAIPDRDKVGACLRRNARGLSPACRSFVVGGGRHYTGRGRTHVRAHHYSHKNH
jgi:hypothetical protein